MLYCDGADKFTARRINEPTKLQLTKIGEMQNRLIVGITNTGAERLVYCLSAMLC